MPAASAPLAAPASVFQRVPTAAAASVDPFGFSMPPAAAAAPTAQQKPAQNAFGEPNLLDL